MAPPNDYRKPKNKELRDLTWNLPHPLRIKDESGKVLWRNKAAESCQGETGWTNFPISWQNRKALLEIPEPVSESEASSQIGELQAEIERLKKQQRQTARKKRQAETKSKKAAKAADASGKRDSKLQEKLTSSEKENKRLKDELAEAKRAKKSSGGAALARETARLEKELAKKTKALTVAQEAQESAIREQKELRAKNKD